jgi:hypothetical protein
VVKYLALLSILFSSLCQADLVASVGVGKGIMYHDGTPFERAMALGYQFNWGDFFIRPEGGYFLDVSGNTKSSLWAAPLFGVRALSTAGPELHLAMGPGYLQNPDQILGGHFQFSLEGGIGISDGKNYLGLAWKHLSSAGFEMPIRDETSSPSSGDGSIHETHIRPKPHRTWPRHRSGRARGRSGHLLGWVLRYDRLAARCA